MVNREVREPKQKRSIEKKNSIIMSSYKLFGDVGYYKTNTVDIAQEAGVSTGIVYSYFQDKKDILIEVIKFYISSLTEQFQPMLAAPINKNNLPAILNQFIDLSIASHSMNRNAHNEFLALSLLEKEIAELFSDFENALVLKVYQLLDTDGFSKTNLIEKVRMSYGLVEQVCHNYIQNKWSQGELDITKELVIRTILTLLCD
ncbi:TetR/AcrR family transcriptional regulator [Anaerocolumna sp. MB42-C2]|uniref:TetR/AcrR family transcriptional regulator n=1 Tax=Anaerocolumna sp. MB42-C2 TaxID=3070997 RepID=UPI0027E16BCE|nr:TetR/AcrR family transcriptional regulator [Anaerocolumna sp. MB42-C2]WMJ87454.1 TetR/AcrR family transcriptional regulator [Anaerocolumna sp. MB42-C2]